MENKLKYPKFLSVSQVAEILGLTPHTVRSYIENGVLPAFRFGKLYRISKTSLDEFISAGKIQSNN